MKNWIEDIGSIICILTVLFGMYLYMDFKKGLENNQKEVLQIPQKHVELKADKKDLSKFEVIVKETKE